MTLLDNNLGCFADVSVHGLTVRVHYHDLGSPLNGLPVVVLLHGSGPAATGMRNFSKNIDHLISNGFRVIALDWPGWGLSDPIVSDDSRSHLNADILKGLLDSIHLEVPVSLVGNSMGAHSAVAFALENAGRVASLVLVGGGNGGRSTFDPSPTEGFNRIVQFYTDPCFQTMRDLMRTVVFEQAAVSDQAVEARLKMAMETPYHIEAYVESRKLCAQPYPDLSYRLEEIVCPAFIIWGQQDRVAPLDLGLRISAQMPNADMHIFSKCGHLPHSEYSTKFNSLLTNFLLSSPLAAERPCVHAAV